MKNMNPKINKWLAVAGGLALCAVLVVLIGQRFQTPKPVDAPLPSQSSEVSKVTVDPSKQDSTEKEKEVTVTPPDTTQPVTTDNGAVSNGTEQTIQGDVSKPEYTEEQRQDPTQKPNGEKVTEPPRLSTMTRWNNPRKPRKATVSPRAAKPRTARFMCRVLDGLRITAVVVRVPLGIVMAILTSRLE